jgi:hypothetical protein
MKDYSWFHGRALKLLNKDSFHYDLYEFLCDELTSYDATSEEFVRVFGTRYFLKDSEFVLEKSQIVETSTNLFALITSDFNDDMDFSLEQWDFIRDLTFSYQSELSIELLNTIVDVLMTRKKLVF